MLTKTTLLAIRTLMHLGNQPRHAPRAPRQIAEILAESPTYLAKVTHQLARAGLVRAERGSRGGVYLARPPEAVSLLEIVEACQGAIVGDACRPDCGQPRVCAFHEAAEQLRSAIVGVLSPWTLRLLMERPAGQQRPSANALPACLMAREEPLLPVAPPR